MAQLKGDDPNKIDVASLREARWDFNLPNTELDKKWVKQGARHNELTFPSKGKKL